MWAPCQQIIYFDEGLLVHKRVPPAAMFPLLVPPCGSNVGGTLRLDEFPFNNEVKMKEAYTTENIGNLA